ncbi:polyketide cyclase / dehydrase [Fragilaria crotonensis]|nr:polyketide cyclase / dehydrase [Fragilaria crotonensis]
MGLRYRIEKTSLIHAPCDEVYNVIADYNQHHGNIIPPHLFGGIEVLKGTGVGSGTRIACTFRLLGQSSTLVMDVSELSGPRGARIIQEIDSCAKNITQFIVIPKSSDSCIVTIRTDVMREIGWVAGKLDELFTRALLNDWYTKELEQLEKYVMSINMDEE